MKHGKKPVVTKRHRAIAKKVAREGQSLRSAMIEHGYSPKAANQGFKALKKRSPALWLAIQKEMTTWAEEAVRILPDPTTRANIARLRLMHTITNSKAKDSDATAAAKLIGQDRDVGMFAPDGQVGILAMNVPNDWKDRYYSLPDEDVVGASPDGRLNDTPGSDVTGNVLIAEDTNTIVTEDVAERSNTELPNIEP